MPCPYCNGRDNPRDQPKMPPSFNIDGMQMTAARGNERSHGRRDRRNRWRNESGQNKNRYLWFRH
jgi:hypothetical protein